MERIAIETTQNVSIEYDIASVGDRIAATFIDWLILFGYEIIILLLFSFVIKPRNMGGLSYSLLFIMIMPFLLYSLLCEVFMNGQSFGKRALKTKVMRMDGRQPSFGNYLLRWILRIIDIDIFSGVIALVVVTVNGKGQRLGDMAAGTLVIKLRNRETISSAAFQKVEDNYVPVFPQAAQLSDKDATTIKQVLRLSFRDTENINMIESKLANKLKAYLYIQSALPDRQFLQTLLKDYNKLSGKL